MSDDLEKIRADITELKHRLATQERDDADLHERFVTLTARVDAHERRLITIAGEQGTNGRIGEARRDLEELKIIVAANVKAIGELKVRIAVLCAGGSAVGGGVVAGIIELVRMLAHHGG